MTVVAQIVNGYFLNPEQAECKLNELCAPLLVQDVLNNYSQYLTIQQLTCLQNYAGGAFSNGFDNGYLI